MLLCLVGCVAVPQSVSERSFAIANSPELEPLPELADPGAVHHVDCATQVSWSAMLATPADTYQLTGDCRGLGTLVLGPAHVGTASRRKVVRGPALLHSFYAGDTLGRATHHWVLHGLTFSGGNGQSSIWMGTYAVVVDSCVFEDIASPYGIRVRLWAHDNTIQQSVFRNPALLSDGVGIQIQVPRASQGSGTMHGNRVVGNDVVNYNDGIQITQAYPENLDILNGTLIDSNRIYLTSDKHTQGGTHALAENAIDVKGGSSDPLDPIVIRRNVMYGFRYFDPAGGSSGSDGVAVTVHNWAHNVRFESNIISDSPGGFRESQWPVGDPDRNRSRGTVYVGNVLVDIQPYAPQDTGYAWKITVPAVLDGNTVARCGVFLGSPGVQVGALTAVGNVAVDCPLGEAETLWGSANHEFE